MKVSYAHYYNIDLPSGISVRDIHIEGRYQEIESILYVDWPNTVMKMQVDKGVTTIYGKSEGYNVFKMTSNSTITIDKCDPYIQLHHDQMNCFAIRSGYFTITIENSNESSCISFIKINDGEDGAYCIYGVDNVVQMKDTNDNNMNNKKVLFIGDDYTCGYGMYDNKIPQVTSDITRSYCSMIAEHYHLQSKFIACHNIGVVRNKNEFNYPSEHTIRTVLNKLNYGDKAIDYNNWNPDYIFINLGSNDFWNIKNYIPVKCPSVTHDIDDIIHENEMNTHDASTTPSRNTSATNNECNESSEELMELKESTENVDEHQEIQQEMDNGLYIVGGLDAMFENEYYSFIQDILRTYQDSIVFIVTGPTLAFEAETIVTTIVDELHKEFNDRIHYATCQLCLHKQNEVVVMNRALSYSDHKTIFDCLLPQIDTYLN